MNNVSQREYQGIRFLEFYPKQKDEKMPVIIYLHGAGERGNDLEKVNVHGPMKEALAGKVCLNCIVFFCQ